MVFSKYLHFVFLGIAMLVSFVGNAQCAMCKASAETSVEAGATAAQGINTGVLYLMFFPFAFLALLGWYAFKMRNPTSN